jgi:hypothetical protein
VTGLVEALISIDEATDTGARKIRPNLQNFRWEVVGRVVLFAFAIGKLGKQLGFFERLLMDGLNVPADSARWILRLERLGTLANYFSIGYPRVACGRSTRTCATVSCNI